MLIDITWMYSFYGFGVARLPTIRQAKKLTLQIPAAAGNLGPGLDTIGLAFGLYCRITFELLAAPDSSIPMVRYGGDVATQSVPKHADNLTYKLLNELWREDRELIDRMRIYIDSDIPLGSGLGGRTSAILGALWADNIFKDRVPMASELLARMSDMEGHSETLAASLMGNLVICARNAAERQVITQQLQWPIEWAHTYRFAGAPLHHWRFARCTAQNSDDAGSDLQSSAHGTACVRSCYARRERYARSAAR